MTDNRQFPSIFERNKVLAEERRAKVLAAAVALAQEDHFQFITRAGVAERAGVVDASVSHAFGSMPDLKRAVLAEAIRTENLKIIAQGMAEDHALTKGIPEALRQAAVTAMLKS